MKISHIQLLLMVIGMAFFQVQCKSSSQKAMLPTCIEDKIETLKNQSVQNPPAEVWQWESNGTFFYYFNAACCDQFSTLYNETCEVVCAPDGGFTGKGDQKCPEFGTGLRKKLIWKDDRKVK